MNEILKYDNINKIYTFLSENDFDNENIEIVNIVKDKKTLNRINDDFFYRLSDQKTENDKPSETDEVVITLGNIRFIYRIKEDDI